MKEKFADTDGLSETNNRRPGDAIPKRKRKKINSVPQNNTQNLIIEWHKSPEGLNARSCSARHIRYVAQQYDKIICTFYVQLNLVYWRYVKLG